MVKEKSSTCDNDAKALSEDILEVINPAYVAVAMLRGASALLANAEAIPDPDGDIWSAREIVDATISKIEEIYMGQNEKRLSERAKALEGGAAALRHMGEMNEAQGLPANSTDCP